MLDQTCKFIKDNKLSVLITAMLLCIIAYLIYSNNNCSITCQQLDNEQQESKITENYNDVNNNNTNEQN